MRRVRHLLDACQKMNVTRPAGFEGSFEDEKEPTDPTAVLFVSTADGVSASMVPDLIQRAQTFATTKNAPQRDPNCVHRLAEELEKRMAPTAKPHTLTDILNAGWHCYSNPDLWKSVPQVHPKDRQRILKDLILKSMEVLEVHARLKPPP